MTSVDSDLSGNRLRVSRTRGAMPGLLLILLGAWGIFIPLIGGYFDFGLAPNDTWNLTNERWWLEVLPGIAVVVGGLLLVIGSDRITTSLGGWVAAAGGVWFVIGGTVQPVTAIDSLGSPLHNSDAGAMAERCADGRSRCCGGVHRSLGVGCTSCRRGSRCPSPAQSPSRGSSGQDS